jgi:hypothetical protein
MKRRNTWLIVAGSALWVCPLAWGCGVAAPAAAGSAATSTPLAEANASVQLPRHSDRGSGGFEELERLERSCDPPWYVDSANIQRLKRECL